jgi:hypothetical protein
MVQFVFNDIIRRMVDMDEESIRVTVIDLMNRAAEAAGTQTVLLLWSVIMAAGGEVTVDPRIEMDCDPTKCFINREATGQGMQYKAGKKE